MYAQIVEKEQEQANQNPKAEEEQREAGVDIGLEDPRYIMERDL